MDYLLKGLLRGIIIIITIIIIIPIICNIEMVYSKGTLYYIKSGF